MKKQGSSYSRSSSTRSLQRTPISFQTIFKRRNETIPTAQLYESKPHSSHQRPLTRSAIVQPSQLPRDQEKPVCIRQFVKQKGINRADLDALPSEKPVNEIQQDNKSVKSSRSNASSFSNFQELRSMALKSPKTIEELQQKIESLINQSMQVLKKQRSNIGLAKWAQIRKSSSLDQDFKQIETYYNDLKQQVSDNEQYSEKLGDLNKKISLLQKMMAAQTTQSELLRQQYFNWKNQRTNTTSFTNKKQLGSVTKFNKEIKSFNTRKSCDTLRTKEAVTKFDSTSKSLFKKPAKQYYLRDKSVKNTYSLNRQPMERSSYSAQYLNYGYVPTYNHKNDSIPQTTGMSLAVKASSYQQQYKQKLGLSKNISVKELDCYHDKFKNPNISFMGNSKKDMNKIPLMKRANENEKENCSFWAGKKSDSSLIACMNMTTTGDFYKSEHKNEYIWHNSVDLDSKVAKEDILKSQIKDKKLMRLKDAFKALAMRK